MSHQNVSKRNVERKAAKRWLDDIWLNFPSIQCICKIFRDVTAGFPAKQSLRNERTNSTRMRRYSGLSARKSEHIKNV